MLPLGSYDVLIRMDWLEKRWLVVNGKDKSINYLSKEGVRHEIQGIQKSVRLHPITANQLSKCL